jgi:hypothetical protein
MSEAGNRKLGKEIGLMMLTPRTDTWRVQSEKGEIPLHSLSANGIATAPRTGWDSNPRYAINVHTLSRRAP